MSDDIKTIDNLLRVAELNKKENKILKAQLGIAVECLENIGHTEFKKWVNIADGAQREVIFCPAQEALAKINEKTNE